MTYISKNKKEEDDKKYSIGEWRLRESVERGKSIEIPSLNLSLNPDGSATSLSKKLF